MKYLKIQNDGLLEPKLIPLMGGTTKANDKFKIGQFGTGLKYTLAFLFRHNVDFHLFVDGEEIKMHTVRENIASEDFEIIYIQDERTSITTSMGVEWSAWMIVRELWCNALDAGDAVKEEVTEWAAIGGKTTFFIQIIPEIREVLENWGNYFIHDTEALSESSTHKIYTGGNRLRLYKQGVLIHQGSEKIPALFSYDIKNADINELREFKGYEGSEIIHALSAANKTVIEYFLQSVTDDVYEGKMDFNWFRRFGPQWREVIGNAKIIHQEAINNIKARGIDMDLTGTICLPKNVFDFLSKEFEGIGALRVADKINEFYEIHSEALSLRLNEVFAILEVCEYAISPELTFIFGVFGDKCKNACINMDSKEVFLSETMLDKSLFDFCAALIEENEHFKSGHPDCSRPFQQHFINLFTKTLLDKNVIKL